jgi:hypothetical protein
MRGGPSGPLRSTGGSAATNGCCCYFSGSCSKHLQGALSDIRQGSLIAISAKLPRLTGRKFQSLCTKQAGQCRLVGPIATERALPESMSTLGSIAGATGRARPSESGAHDPAREYGSSDWIGNRELLCPMALKRLRCFWKRGELFAMPDGDDVQRYLTRARCCVEIASTMSDVQQRLILLEMAQVWMRLANQSGANESTGLSNETPKATTPPSAEC